MIAPSDPSLGFATTSGRARLRILHVVPSYWPAVRYGGPIRSVHSLCQALASRGHRVDVFTTNVDGRADTAVPIGRPVDMDGVQVTYFESRKLRRLYWAPAMSLTLAAQIASYDVVHLHSVFLWPTWAAARRARVMNVPYIVSPRGMLVPDLIRRKSRWVKNAWIALIEQQNLKRAAAIHATSDVEAKGIASFGWHLPPVVVIPNGVDDPVDYPLVPLSPDVHAAIAAGKFVLALGRINWKKGLDRLITCLPLAPHTRLIIAGDDDEGLAALLAREALRSGVADRVTILARHVDGADKEALFASALIVAMPSISENFGLVGIEAMRRGRPVLVTPEVGIANIVREAGSGIVVEREVSAMAQSLGSLLQDPRRARAMGIAGHAHVIAHFGWGSIAEKMESLYTRILSAGT